MPYDTVAYKAKRGDIEAQKKLAERPPKEKRDYKKDPPVMAKILRLMMYVDWGRMIREEERQRRMEKTLRRLQMERFLYYSPFQFDLSDIERHLRNIRWELERLNRGW